MSITPNIPALVEDGLVTGKPGGGEDEGETFLYLLRAGNPDQA